MNRRVFLLVLLCGCAPKAEPPRRTSKDWIGKTKAEVRAALGAPDDAWGTYWKYFARRKALWNEGWRTVVFDFKDDKVRSAD